MAPLLLDYVTNGRVAERVGNYYPYAAPNKRIPAAPVTWTTNGLLLQLIPTKNGATFARSWVILPGHEILNLPRCETARE